MKRLSSAIVFDFGGVLVNWDPHYLYRPLFNGDDAAIDRFLREIGFHEWNLQQDGGRSFDEGVAVLSAQFPQHATLIRAYHERYVEAITGPIEGTVEILRACQATGYPLYGLSNWAQEKFDLVRPLYAFFDCFDDILISSTVNLVKPDPRIFEIFLQRIGRRAEDCVYIDDSAANVAVADRLGFTAVHFEAPRQLAAELDRLGVLHLNGHR
ncbi:2-haloacid dehalogenase [Thermoflexales bacterium]|nr:2-haloacid dehalogenase [Thermoflexales bacterium]